MKKIDNSFAIEQFLIGGFTPYRLDKNYFGGGIMTCSGRFIFKISIIDNIPSNLGDCEYRETRTY